MAGHSSIFSAGVVARPPVWCKFALELPCPTLAASHLEHAHRSLAGRPERGLGCLVHERCRWFEGDAHGQYTAVPSDPLPAPVLA
eukprot:scaffold3056_cov70-Phaeocystis_antarctica.AAC.4